MPRVTQTGDLTTQYRGFDRVETGFRPVAATTYTPGELLALVGQDLQNYPDGKCVGLPSTSSGAQQNIVAFVSEAWPGFSGSLAVPPNYTSPSNLNALRGTLQIDGVLWGYHPGVLLDQSGTSAVTVVNGQALVPSRATAGYVQGGSTTAPPGGQETVAFAVLPSGSGASPSFGYSLTATSLAQAAGTATVATPAAGDTLNMTIQTPYVASAPGVVQKTTWSLTLTAADAVSATTAAAAMVAYLNGQTSFNAFFVATNTAGAILVTVVAASPLFRVNYASGIDSLPVANYFDISLSGMVANTLTTAASVTGSGGTTFSFAETTFGADTAGTGFKGYIPAFVALL